MKYFVLLPINCIVHMENMIKQTKWKRYKNSILHYLKISSQKGLLVFLKTNCGRCYIRISWQFSCCILTKQKVPCQHSSCIDKPKRSVVYYQVCNDYHTRYDTVTWSVTSHYLTHNNTHKSRTSIVINSTRSLRIQTVRVSRFLIKNRALPSCNYGSRHTVWPIGADKILNLQMQPT